jgi:L-rhamnose mutarotase
VERIGRVIRIRPECIEEYKRHHANVWPGVLRVIEECHIRNYSIFVHGGMLFSYYEYIGEDYQADLERMVADPRMAEWSSIMQPMMEPLPTRAPGEWFARMDEVFHAE